MYPDGLSENERLKVKELCTMVNISDEDAVRLLKENDWDIAITSRRVSKQEDKSLVPGTSHEEIDLDRFSSRLRVHGLAFYLPDFAGFPNEFRTFLEKDLIETQTQKRLEASRHLNWWHQFGQKLYPLSTTGDGNCLLHAASLGMWGVHDRQLSLRETLYELLTNGARKEAIRRRWKWVEHHSYQSNGLALTLSDAEWQLEWDVVLGLSSPLPRKQEDNGSNSTDQIYESLEQIHVFALAHVLKRPIVVVSDTILRNAKGEELSPVSFGGVYLPLECPPSQCHRSPLVLCYDSAHFSPLVLMRTETNNKQIIPIIDVNRNLLPVHFAVDPGANFDWSKAENECESTMSEMEMSQTEKLALISQYMDIIRLDVRRGSIRSTRRVRSAHAQLTDNTHSLQRDTTENGGEIDQAAAAAAKSMTLASSGIGSGRHEKWRLINEIRCHVLRTLRISTSSKSKEKLIGTDDCIARMNSTCVLASELLPTHHQYMDKIINEYMKSAKQRFQQNQRTNTTNTASAASVAAAANANADSRKRISRSFSASSLMLTCIGCDSEFKPASQVTNIMCDQCFAWQKMSVLTAIGNGPPPCKSSTLPSFGVDVHSDKENIVEVLNVVSNDGASALTSMRAVEDENGVVHYYVDDDVTSDS